MAAIAGLISSSLLVFSGHTQGQYIYRTQPMKMASIEALWWSEKPASFSILTIGDLSGKKLVWEVRFPTLLSFISCNNFTCEVRGVTDLQYQYTRLFGPGDYVPLMVVTYWSFRIMLVIGLLMALLSLAFLIALRRNLENAKWMKWVPWVIILPYIANISGWVLAEVGRQPWIVQGMLKVEDGVSPNLTTLDLLISLIGYILIYSVLGAIMFKLMRKYALTRPETVVYESIEIVSSIIGVDD